MTSCFSLLLLAGLLLGLATLAAANGGLIPGLQWPAACREGEAVPRAGARLKGHSCALRRQLRRARRRHQKSQEACLARVCMPAAAPQQEPAPNSARDLLHSWLPIPACGSQVRPTRLQCRPPLPYAPCWATVPSGRSAPTAPAPSPASCGTCRGATPSRCAWTSARGALRAATTRSAACAADGATHTCGTTSCARYAAGAPTLVLRPQCSEARDQACLPVCAHGWLGCSGGGACRAVCCAARLGEQHAEPATASALQAAGMLRLSRLRQPLRLRAGVPARCADTRAHSVPPMLAASARSRLPRVLPSPRRSASRLGPWAARRRAPGCSIPPGARWRGPVRHAATAASMCGPPAGLKTLSREGLTCRPQWWTCLRRRRRRAPRR